MKPLSEHALAELRDIVAKPVPNCAVNPGVANKLLREGLVEEVQLRSPFATHAGKLIGHLKATATGRARISGYGISHTNQKDRGCFPAHNQGEWYAATKFNGVWHYFVWTPDPTKAHRFNSIEEGRAAKHKHGIPGRVKPLNP